MHNSQLESELLLDIYGRLFAAYGPQGWWPSQSATKFEIIVGSILTQGTGWRNVERSIANIIAAGAMDVAVMHSLPRAELIDLIHPSGYYNAKAAKLQAFTTFLYAQHSGSLESLFALSLAEMRRQLLAVWGIGPETADAIILYAAEQPIFVVDAYTRRIFGRMGLAEPNIPYHALQEKFARLRPDVPLYNEFHALLDHHGLVTCKPTTPRCHICPLLDLPCAFGRMKVEAGLGGSNQLAIDSLYNTLAIQAGDVSDTKLRLDL